MLTYQHTPEVIRTSERVCSVELSILDAQKALKEALSPLEGIICYKVELSIWEDQQTPVLQLYVRAVINGQEISIHTNQQTIEGAIAQVLQWYTFRQDALVYN